MNNNFSRIIKFGFQNFGRNAWLSVVTVIILSLALFLISLLVAIQFLGNQAINNVIEKIDVAVFFTQNTTNQQVDTVAKQLRSRAEVVNIEIISAEQAYENFKQENVDDPVILESLEELGLNPLGPVLVIKARTLDDYDQILGLFDSESLSPLIQDKDRDFTSKQLVIERLSEIVKQLRRAGLILAGVFVIIALLVMYNTIRIKIYTHRDEIAIMKLVGASNAFVRSPYIVESIIYAVIATVVTTMLFAPAVVFAAPLIDRFFEGYDFNLLSYFKSNLLILFIAQLVSAVFISTVSAALAVGRYLRV